MDTHETLPSDVGDSLVGDKDGKNKEVFGEKSATSSTNQPRSIPPLNVRFNDFAKVRTSTKSGQTYNYFEE